MTQVTVGPPWAADGPVPQAPAHNLLSVSGVLVPDTGDEHWLVGIEVWPYPRDLPNTVDPCASGTFRVKDEGIGWNLPIFGPFTAYMPITCSSIVAKRAGFQDRVRLAFEARESYAVAYELAHGHAQPLNPFLSDGNVHILAAGAVVSPDVGLAYLEDAIGETGGTGMIHATPAVASSWNGASGGYGVEDRGDGQLKTTANKTPVAVSAAYRATPRFGTDPASDTQAWVYATSLVQVRRQNDIRIVGNLSESLDRSDNTVTFRAERGYVVTFDAPETSSDEQPVQAAVLVDWGGCVLC